MAEEFTIAPIRRLLKKAGNLRINEEAANSLRSYIGSYGQTIADLAIENAISEKRKTVLERDIRAAASRIWEPEEKETE